MEVRPYPSSMPNSNPNPHRTLNGARTTTKPPPYGSTRPAYRRQPPPPSRRHRHHSGCCCSFLLWLTLLLLALTFLAAIVGGVFYVLYRPHRPTFSVTSLNLVSTTQLTSRFDLSVTARNPNRKLVFLYDAISIAANSNGVRIGDGSFPAFVHGTENTTVLMAMVSSPGMSLGREVASDLKKKRLKIKIELKTKARVKIGWIKTMRIDSTVSCDGIEVAISKGKKAADSGSFPAARCELKLLVHIWKWTL